MGKKIFAMLVLLVMAASMFTSCQPKEVKIEKIEVKTLPQKTVFTEEEAGQLDIEGLEILLTISNGKTEVENVKEVNALSEGTYTITEDINYDKAGEYYVTIARKETENSCNFKVTVEPNNRTYSDELNLNDYAFNSIDYMRDGERLYKDNLLIFRNVELALGVFNLKTKELSYAGEEALSYLEEKDYIIEDYFSSSKYYYLVVNSSTDNESKILVWDFNMAIVKEISLLYEGTQYNVAYPRYYNDKIYLNLYTEDNKRSFFELNEETLELNFIIEEYVECIVQNNLIFEYDNSVYRYSLTSKRTNLVFELDFNEYSLKTKGDYLYIKQKDFSETSDALKVTEKCHKVSYDGKEISEYKYVEDCLPVFLPDETYFITGGDMLIYYLDFYYYDEENDELVDLNEKNKHLKDVIAIYSNGADNYLMIYTDESLYLLEFEDVNDLINFDGDATKLVRLGKD